MVPFSQIRYSLLDPHHMWSQKSPSRGFISVFWVFMFFQFAMRLYHNYLVGGSIMQWTIARVFFSDAAGFWMLEALLIATCYLGLLLERLSQPRVFIPRAMLWCFRANLEACMLGIPIMLMHQRGWHPLQKGAFMLHSIAMTMKVHSFASSIGMTSFEARTSFGKFTNYLLSPTLVYEVQPPKTPHIRWLYVAEKAFGMFMSGSMLYLTIEGHIYPVLAYDFDHVMPLSILDVSIKIFPSFFASMILLFFLTFECILNLLAELSTSANREFYSDWWNRYTARRANRPLLLTLPLRLIVVSLFVVNLMTNLHANGTFPSTSSSVDTFTLRACHRCG